MLYGKSMSLTSYSTLSISVHQVDIILLLRDVAIFPRSALADLIMDAMTSSVKSSRIYRPHEA